MVSRPLKLEKPTLPMGELNDKLLVRKRKLHRKSRYGCANCKLRSLKCDEAKPCCRKCISSSICCVYGSKFSPDTLSTPASFRVDLSPAVIRSSPISLPVSGSIDTSETYQLTPQDMVLIEKFRTRTVLTLGSISSRHIYAKRLLPIAFAYPFVMHVVLAVAQIHDLTMQETPTDRETRVFTYHWDRAISSLKSKIAQDIIPQERDALWISVALVSIGSFAAVEAKRPTEAWPLRPNSRFDLAWLNLCDGKRLVTQLTCPCREDSTFCYAARELQMAISHMEDVDSRAPAWNALPTGFQDLFRLSKGPANNPYYIGAMAMAEIFPLKLNEKNPLPHLSFISTLDTRFRDLLRQKDERAMLIVLYWYSKICDPRLWWMWKQAWTEGLAICGYLENSWSTRPGLIALLAEPKKILKAHQAVY